MESRQATHHIYILEVCLLAVLILLNIKSGHARISVSKIVIPKAVRINPCIYVIFYSVYNKIFLKAIERPFKRSRFFEKLLVLYK